MVDLYHWLVCIDILMYTYVNYTMNTEPTQWETY